MAAKKNPNELCITRLYDAPVKAVWDAWTDPEQVTQWWGPRCFTLSTHAWDLRSGGSWVFTMHGPDGTDYPNKTQYHEVAKYQRLVYDHGANDDRPPLFRVTVLFSDFKGKTKMEMTMALPTADAAEQTKKFVRKANGESTWDRLAEYLTKTATGKEVFVINRSFEAPIDLVYDMWTNPSHIEKWMPPTGATMQYIKADIRPGGTSHYCMKGPGGAPMYGKASYVAFEKPHRIVYTQCFVDEKGDISRHPMAPTWPETMLTIVTLAEEETNHTRVTVQWEPHGNVTPEELKTFVAMRPGMTGGWSGSFDKFEAHLAG